MKKVLLALVLLPVAAFPYAYFMNACLGFPLDSGGVIGLGWLAGLAAAVLAALARSCWTGRELALANMLVKLLQIPAYGLWFAVGLAMFLFMGPVLAFLMDVLAILLTGLVGLAAVLRCRKEEKLGRKAAVIHGILQFVFCADVFSAVWVYIKSRKEKESVS